MHDFTALKRAVQEPQPGAKSCLDVLAARALRAHLRDPSAVAKGYAAAAQLREHKKHIYEEDLIAGSLRGKLAGPEIPAAEFDAAEKLVSSFGRTSFWTNRDHYAPDFETVLSVGVGGLLAQINASMEAHRADADFTAKRDFLTGARAAMEGFADMILGYARAAEDLARTEDGERRERMTRIAADCRRLSAAPPENFRQALQLVWFVHLAFLYEGRYAMALGRLDQYLYPFYARDAAAGRLTYTDAVALLRGVLIKIGESRLFGGDDVVNIAIGGVDREGNDALNPLSWAILEAVRDCRIPGPNLSARVHKDTDPRFLDACLQVVGTGLGYPALMNDEVNIPALARHGYSLADCRDYCMVGCIENFIPGKQPPWSDGRFNVPRYIEAVLNRGDSLLDGAPLGPDTGELSALDTMEKFVAALETQLVYAADEYMAVFHNENDRYNRARYAQPFLSCFCRDCIARGLDVNDGGALYPSVHGAGCMGIATVADSLAAVERVVYEEGLVTLEGLRDALAANFAGRETLRRRLQNCPKYGNDDDFVDKYAVWYVECCDRVFAGHRTRDGGAVYTAIASNVNNIPAGREVAATPDGRLAGEPLSDAASPMRGCDQNGPTAALNSCAKPDYRLVSCGTVVNQKYGPEMFADPALRAKLLVLIRTYFDRGGQEIQINAVSRDVLRDAMRNPADYTGLVVRVSGFSAYFIHLDPDVQADILARTEHA